MDREISSATWLAVSLVSLAAFLSIALWTVYLGNNLRQDTIDQSTDLAAGMQSGELDSLVNNTQEMNMAQVYNLLSRNYQNVTELDVYEFGTGTNLGGAYDAFIATESADPGVVSGITPVKWITNSQGYWTMDGKANDKTDHAYVMCYEVISNQTGLLKGRCFIVANKLSNDTLRVKILHFS